MKKMKVTKKELGLLIGLLGVLIAVACYTLVYTPKLDEIALLESELATLEQQEQKYEELAANVPFYQEGIEKMTEENDKIIAEFPAGIQPETEIMYVVGMEQALEDVELKIPSISYGSPTSVLAEGSSGSLNIYQVSAGLSYSTTYDGLKKMITYTNDYQDRMVIDTISVAYDSTTGNVSGSLTLNMYYLTGTDKIYQDPTVPEMDMGVDNIFGTID